MFSILRPMIAAAFVAFLFPSGCGDECAAGETGCEGNTAVVCASGGERKPLVFHREACGQKHCVVQTDPKYGNGPAICAIEATPDPKCEPATAVYCREESLLAKCRLGYRVEETKCQDPTKCFVSGGVSGSCVFARPSPACFDVQTVLGGDAESRSTCAMRWFNAGGEHCPATALPSGDAPGCCAGLGRCGVLLEQLAADGKPIGCIDLSVLRKPTPTETCDSTADGGTSDAEADVAGD